MENTNMAETAPPTQPAPAAEKDAPSKMTPEMIAEHKAMMSGAMEPGKPGDKDYEARNAYRKAFEEHVAKFLNGELTDANSKTINNREEALTHAHLAGLKAVQSLKKSGLKMRVFAD